MRHRMSEAIMRSDKSWKLAEDELNLSLKNGVREALFSVGNGIFCTRGSNPFCASGMLGTQIGGLYSEGPAELVWIPEVGHPARDVKNFPSDDEIKKNERILAPPVVPNIWNLQFAPGMAKAEVVSSKRELDMKQAVLFTNMELNVNGKTWRLESQRFVSVDDRGIAYERLIFETDGNNELEILVGVDAKGLYANRENLWRSEVFKTDGNGYVSWIGETVRTGQSAAVTFKCVSQNADIRCAGNTPIGTAYVCKLRGCGVIERFVAVNSTVMDEDIENTSVADCGSAIKAGSLKLFKGHVKAMDKLWARADIGIEGPDDDQKALRFSIFQIITALPLTGKYSMGAKFLTDQWYRSVVFWDMDIFGMQYLIRTFPERALEHLEFRYRTLEAAKREAILKGFKGSKYPWESFPDGSPAIPRWLVLGDTQVHVTADVAWAVLEYFRWTGDMKFMEDMGREMLVENCRFWMSRVDRASGDINNVCGPDEYHAICNNNAFTNELVRHVLRSSAELCKGAVSEQEIADWLSLADKIKKPSRNNDNVIEQFEGFFKLPVTEITKVKFEDDKFQVIKQADLLMLPFLFHDYFSREDLRANYDYYLPKTTHHSSLSRGVYAIIAARCGKADEAYSFFRKIMNSDLDDIYGNTEQGIHAAAAFLVPLCVIIGFADMELDKDGKIRNAPNLPAQWKSVELKCSVRGKVKKMILK